MKWFFLLLCGLAVATSSGFAATPAPELSGQWSILSEKSSPIELFDTLSLEINASARSVEVMQHWGNAGDSGLTLRDTVIPDGQARDLPVTSRDWPTIVFMAVSMDPQAKQSVTARWADHGRSLVLDRKLPVLVSQGATTVRSRETYALSQYGDQLTLTIDRPERPGPPFKYVFKRAGTKAGYVLTLTDNWNVSGHLDDNALLISLQGIVNTDAPKLYLLYPPNWDFRETTSVYDYYRQHLDYTFQNVPGIDAALKLFRPQFQGYVVWDPAARTSLEVAFTVAGLDRALVVTERQIPLMQKLGLSCVADFRGKFTGQTDEQIFRWAYEQYGARCSRDYIVWLGGEAGDRMLPGIADFGIAKHAFFTDLSTNPKRNPTEYALAKEILSKQKELSMLMGWHSYAKDRERDYVSLASHFGLRIEGLNTYPDLSFTSQTPTSPGFVFRNHHTVVPGKTYTPQKNKVYLSCIQTDGLGLGAWNHPGRGDIPYAWEVTINWLWMCPTMLEYYYTTASPNDFFIGAITGPGYMYPKAIPPAMLPKVIALANDMIRKLDINVFETMDYSEGATVTGTTEIPKRIVDAYYQGMPEVIGFANGYAPAFTFASHDGRPFVSFDYYLPEKRPEADVANDLRELAKVNPQRPYFLLVHVREWSDISRVKSILDQLGSGYETVPLDVFLKMAGQDPTFQERYQPEPTGAAKRTEAGLIAP